MKDVLERRMRGKRGKREWWGVEDECVMLQGFWSSFEDRVQKASVQNVSATQIVRLGKGPV